MSQIKKSGGWDSSYGGREFKSSGGKVQFTGQEKGKGTTPIGSGNSEGKKGQINFLGAGGSKGMVSKGKGGTSKAPICD